MAHYAIGDIQGCYIEFSELLEKIAFDPTKDQLWLVGDLVNRGPQSLQTLRLIRELGDSVISILGNHDLHLLAVYYGISEISPEDTFHDILGAPDCGELIDWLRHRPLLHYDTELNFLMVHAGLAPQWTLIQAQDCAREVETLIQSREIVDFLKNMYGNQPDIWSDALIGWDRLRVITNYLTRVRYCDAKGRMDFEHKGDITPEGFYPWYKVPNRHTQGLRIVYGHWAALKGCSDSANIFAIDTGCAWGDSLTALRLEDLQRFSVASKQS
ncbi:MAG: symmetrical bis(5'-nucleosyl)-tetraphosphatase [Gammaproteobacteria bacterium]|nr:symmetrical bis(5'-nucleosyl)-tetraphosphatase [Gammaproteobacteria bacterium]